MANLSPACPLLDKNIFKHYTPPLFTVGSSVGLNWLFKAYNESNQKINKYVVSYGRTQMCCAI